ncbi:hypothetical protein [Henriciella mobilis]|nr:hypothetical protein [Henriciella mobilis]
MKKFIVATVVAGSMGSLAFASASDMDTWRVASTSDEGTVLTVVSGTDTKAGTFFSCTNGTLKFGVGLEGGDLAETLATDTHRQSRRQAETTIGDGETFESDWTYLPSMKVAIARNEVTAKKFYNAAVRKDTVSWKLDRKSEIELSFPELNDAFKSFANDCSVTNPDAQ